MKPIESRFVVAGLLILFTILSGYWVSHSGKPLNVVIFTIHKLIALAAVIVIGVTLYQLRTGTEMRLPLVSAMVLTGLFFLLLFVSGALLSLDKPVQGVVLIYHRVGPYLATLSTAATLYLVASGQ